MRRLRCSLAACVAMPTLSSCATWEAVRTYPEATAAIVGGFLSDILSLFMLFI